MGIPVLILGESGTGKTTSLRNFKKEDIAIVNVAGKPLPFRDPGFDRLNNSVSYYEIAKFMKETKAKSIIIDDAQYIMSFQYMRRIKEQGWDKFNELQSDFFGLIDYVSRLPEDVIVYFLSHIETRDDGRQKIKTIGKMLDEKITIEGMFTTVLKTGISNGEYFFFTQNSGLDTTKSPLGMFPSFAIDNDLKYVDDKIRNYYQIGTFKSDAEMTNEDERVKTDLEQSNGRVKRATRAKRETAEEPVSNDKAEAKEVIKEQPKAPEKAAEEPRRRTRKTRETNDLLESEYEDGDIPF